MIVKTLHFWLPHLFLTHIPFWTDVSPATPADSASLPSSHSEAVSAQPFYPLGSTAEQSGTPDAGHHGSSHPCEEMKPQKMNASGNLSSSSSLDRPSSKPSGKNNKGAVGEIQPFTETTHSFPGQRVFCSSVKPWLTEVGEKMKGQYPMGQPENEAPSQCWSFLCASHFHYLGTHSGQENKGMQGHSEALYKEDEFPQICVFPFLCAITF